MLDPQVSKLFYNWKEFATADEVFDLERLR